VVRAGRLGPHAGRAALTGARGMGCRERLTTPPYGRRCMRPVKWLVGWPNQPPKFLCGLHARLYIARGWPATPYR
jgi:hypothetical protein